MEFLRTLAGQPKRRFRCIEMKKVSDKQQKISDTATYRPLVTFALFAYDQEDYIREAVEGAFAQTYEPLEIILSDDCSNDRTFEIMREMASSYQGPHTVRLRQEKQNQGTLNHVCSVVSDMRGKYMVLAAGDDISLPHRTKFIVNSWTSECKGIFSACDLINENGSILQASWVPPKGATTRMPWLRDTFSDLFVYGASSAYSRELLKLLPKSKDKILSEDTALNLLLQFQGGQIVRCKEVLVKYRVHSGTTSANAGPPRPSLKEIVETERRLIRSIEARIDLLFYIKLILIPSSEATEIIEHSKLDEDIEFNNLRLKWYAANPITRMGLFRHIFRKNFRWFIGRTFGLTIYSALRFTLIRARLLPAVRPGTKA